MKDRNMQFLYNLFAGQYVRPGIIMDPGYGTTDKSEGDFTTSTKPISHWVPQITQIYEQRLRWHEQLDDDSVPFASLVSGTQLFADAFGCEVHTYSDSNPCALPLVSTAEQADAIPEPTLNARCLQRVFEMALAAQRALGPECVIGVPDIQSPLDIAALIWRKEDMFLAMHDEPEAVTRLIDKCERLVDGFITEFLRICPNGCLSHVPYVWTPQEMGICISEDEVGSISPSMFEQFAAPSLNRLSKKHGGLFMHCCANADHQYKNFTRLKNLRGLNRVFQATGPMPAIRAFENRTVLVMAWIDETTAFDLIDMALPGTRYLFSMSAGTLDEARGVVERMHKRPS